MKKKLTALQIAVIEQLGYKATDYTDDTSTEHADLSNTLEDIANHGADTGWHGFTYLRETLSFTAKNSKTIREAVKQLADDIASDPVEFILSFRCLDKKDKAQKEAAGRFIYHGPFSDSKSCDSEEIYNSLAWFALEEVARELSEEN
jgi:hypothetical protein